jgi:dihydrofolate reductase
LVKNVLSLKKADLMRKLILIAQTSLDGFVAGPKGEFDNFVGGEENLEFVCSLTDTADAALLGRKSYLLLDEGWPSAATRPDATKNEIKYSNWYNRVPKIVLSQTLLPDIEKKRVVLNENITDEIKRLKSQSGQDILAFGSPTVVHFLIEQNLLDSFWLIIHPVIFGKGIPLFQEAEKPIKAGLSQTKQLSSGTIALKYDIRT